MTVFTPAGVNASVGSEVSPPTPTGPGRLRYIDALRGVAASWVLLYHFYSHLSREGTLVRLPRPLHDLILSGHLGVEIFFVLSGFVIAYAVADSVVTPRFFGRFALRRSLRLDPPYWATIFASFAVLSLTSRLGLGRSALARPSEFSAGGILLANMFYLDNILGAPSIVKVGWTLCLEVQFYLVYILLCGLMQRADAAGLPRHGSRAIVFAPLALYSLAIAAGLAAFPYPGFFFEYWYLFFLGAVASWTITRRSSPLWLYGFAALAIASLAVSWDSRTVVALLTAASIVGLGRAGRLSTALDWPWLQYLGAISYSLYLLHPLIGHRVLRLGMRRFGDPLPTAHAVAFFACATTASVLAAHAMNRIIEAPSIRLSKRISLKPPA